MAKGAVTGDIGAWEGVDKKLVAQAFKRGVKTGAASSGSGDVATLSALKKVIEPKAYSAIQTGAFAKHAKANKLSLDAFLTKEWFMAMAGGKEPAAIDMAKKMACNEQAAQEKDAQGSKKGNDVTSRLTDTSKYTGSHGNRFDKDGKGRGAEGREDRADGSGYVGGYKGKDTYGKGCK